MLLSARHSPPAMAGLCLRRATGRRSTAAGWGRPADRPTHGGAAGFTLVELLLVVVLMLLLLGAVVFNFSTLQRGAVLEEGTQQTEALLRFARAYAAGTGRQVEIRFEEILDENLAGSSRIQVRWEPDPLLRPGFFEPLREADTYLAGIQELVRVESVITPGGAGLDSAAAASGRGSSSLNGNGGPGWSGGQPSGPVTLRAEATDATGTAAPVVIRFYPDGSSDSTRLLLAALDEEETRRMELLLQGDTGILRRRLVSVEETGREDAGSNTIARAEAKDSEGAPAPLEEELPVAR